jgi:hypothetical protein
MDIVCKWCGEPWDADELHVEHIPHPSAVLLFKRLGCGAFDAIMGQKPRDECKQCATAPIYPPEHMELLQVAAEMSGDDVESMAADAELANMAATDDPVYVAMAAGHAGLLGVDAP